MEDGPDPFEGRPRRLWNVTVTALVVGPLFAASYCQDHHINPGWVVWALVGFSILLGSIVWLVRWRRGWPVPPPHTGDSLAMATPSQGLMDIIGSISDSVRRPASTGRPAEYTDRMSEAATIRIKRQEGAWRDRFRSYKVVVDGEVVGRIGDGGTMEFPVLLGEHTLKLKIDWTGRRELPFSIRSGEVRAFSSCPFTGPAIVEPSAGALTASTSCRRSSIPWRPQHEGATL